jgi:DNA-binding LacI/PurR family transcriptional regulator
VATINDIAEITGYSKSTISRALKNNTRISKKTRDEILKIAKELNYLPNSKAVSLSTGRSFTLGVIVPYPTFNSYYANIIHSIINATFKKGYKVSFLPSNYDKETELSYLKMLQAKEFDGLIITSAANSYTLIAEFLKYGMIVSCEETGSSGVSSIILERIQGYASGFVALQKLKIKHIGLCFSRTLKNSVGAREVLQFFKDKLPHFTDRTIFENCREFDDGIKAGEYFSELSPQIEAIFANSDEIAAGIIQFYQQHNLSLPIIIGQENQAIGKFLQISSIDFRLEELGKEAVDMCLNGQFDKKILKSRFYHRGNL